LVGANITQNIEAGELGAIDWDFWTDAQEGEAAEFAEIKSVRDERRRNLVQISYQFYPSPAAKPVPKQSDLILVRDLDGCWLVDDIVHNGSSASRLLEAGTSSRVSGK
jgi:hypothetical protein